MALTITMVRNVRHSGVLLLAGSTQSLPDDVARQFVYEGRATMVSTDPAAAGKVPLMAAGRGGVITDVLMGNASVTVPSILTFPDFAPSILASFVVGTTASQAGNTVTVTAPAHGIVGGTAKQGYRIYYPGSPSIPAGWYSNFVWIDVNTVTFQRAFSAIVASESVNGGIAFLSQVTICSLMLPGGSMGPNGKISLCSLRSTDGAASKFLRLAVGAQIVSGISLGALSGEGRLTLRNIQSESVQRASAAVDGSAGGAPYVFTNPMTEDQVISVVATVSSSGGWLAVDGVELEVVKL